MKSSYGDPPHFVPALFLKIYAGLLVFVAGGAVAAYMLGSPLGTVDLCGLLVTTPLAAFLVHLWLLPMPGAGDSRGRAE